MYFQQGIQSRNYNPSLYNISRGIMKKFLLVGLLLGMLSGCYTQFSTLKEKAPPPPKVTYEFDSATGDTVKVYSPIDTIARGANQTCYWPRNIWGEPELRCDNSSYSQDWYLYNDYPWWYNRDSYIYDAYGRCPRYYYYDESCRGCRYYSTGVIPEIIMEIVRGMVPGEGVSLLLQSMPMLRSGAPAHPAFRIRRP